MKSLISKLFKWRFSLKKKIYRHVLSGNKPSSCGKIKQPTLFLGKGKIHIEKTATLGYFPSAHFYSGYLHIEARSEDSEIFVGEDTFINNSSTIIADKAKISIGKRCLIGKNFHCVSADFHGINPEDRETYAAENVTIGDNVFIGSDVTILKGVTIGGGGNDRCKLRRYPIVSA